jgi:hypothetical protein
MKPGKTIRLWFSNKLIAEMERRRGEKSVDDFIDAMLRRELGLEPAAPGEGF